LWAVKAAIVLLCILLVSCPFAYADRCLISVSPDASIYEPGQKAIVAWNGHEEILILSTDVSASRETLVLEILPLPSKPIVEAASFQSFEEIRNMILMFGDSFRFLGGQGSRTGGVEILFYEQIGAHNITVVSATESPALLELANGFLSASGVNHNVTLQGFEEAIQNYMGRGFRYYALDLITFSPEEKSIEPILYRFNSSMLYYPLVITSPVGGNGNVTVFALTKGKLDEHALAAEHAPLNLAYYTMSNGQLQFIQFKLPTDVLLRLDLRLNDLLPGGAWLSVLKREGNLALFDQDLVLTERDFDYDEPVSITFTLPLSAGELGFILATLLIGILLTLAGFAFSFFMLRQTRKNQLEAEFFT
jgi:hypothetical protein